MYEFFLIIVLTLVFNNAFQNCLTCSVNWHLKSFKATVWAPVLWNCIIVTENRCELTTAAIWLRISRDKPKQRSIICIWCWKLFTGLNGRRWKLQLIATQHRWKRSRGRRSTMVCHECKNVKKLVPRWVDCSSLDSILFKIVLDHEWKSSPMMSSTWPNNIKFREFKKTIVYVRARCCAIRSK